MTDRNGNPISDFAFGNQDMDFYRAAQENGWKVIGEEALPDLTSSALAFPNAPTGTRMVVFTVRTAKITLREKGGTASATVGEDYAAGGPYALPLNDTEAKIVTGFGSGTGYTEYWGMP